MAEPITWQAIETVAVQLRTILMSSGYHTNLGLADVLTDRHQVPESRASTLVAAGAVTTLTDKSSQRRTTSEMEIIIEFAQPFGDSISAELIAHRARADIVSALSQPLRVGYGGVDVRVTGSQFLPHESGASAIVAQITARAVLTETLTPAP